MGDIPVWSGMDWECVAPMGSGLETDPLVVDGDIELPRAGGSRTISIPDANGGGRSLTIAAGGNVSSSGGGATGGELILRAGNANVSAPRAPCSDDPYGNSIKLYAGGNTFGAFCGSARAGDIIFYAGDEADPNARPERLRLDGDDGNLGIGVSNPLERLHVNGNVLANNVGAPSDARFKENVVEIDDALDLVLAMRGVRYDLRADEFPGRAFDERRHIGFIAQELEEILPEVVREQEDGYRSVDYTRLGAVFAEAIQAQHAQIEDLEDRNERLRDRVAKLEQRQRAIDARLDGLEVSKGFSRQESPAGQFAIPAALLALLGASGLLWRRRR